MNKNQFLQHRIEIIDIIRGFAVFLMIIFHCSFDLNLLNFVSLEMIRNKYWYFFPRIIVFLFLFCTGCSLVMTYQNNIRWNKFGIRMLKLVSSALLISISTYILFPHRWIYFGTLHSIAFLSVIGLIFIRFPKISLILGLVLFLFEFLGFHGTWIKLSHSSMDYISPFPWFGAILFGIFSAHYISFNNNFIKKVPIPIKRPFQFLGKYSLVIYLTHQPILFGSLYLIKKLL